MQSNTVQIDISERSSGLRFAPNYNVAVSFVDRHITEGRGAKVAIRRVDSAVTYDELAANVTRLGRAGSNTPVLVEPIATIALCSVGILIRINPNTEMERDRGSRKIWEHGVVGL